MINFLKKFIKIVTIIIPLIEGIIVIVKKDN